MKIRNLIGLSICTVCSLPAGDAELSQVVREMNTFLLAHAVQVPSSVSADKTSSPTEVELLLRQRGSALRNLLTISPESALSQALPPEIKDRLAATYPAAERDLEIEGVWEGILDYQAEDGANAGNSRSVTMIHVNGENLEVHFAGLTPPRTPGEITRIAGVRFGNSIVATDATAAGVSATATACSTTGAQKTAVILVTLPNVTLPPGVSADGLRQIFFGTTPGVSVNGFVQTASNGQASVSGDVFGPFTLQGSYSTCGDVGGAMLNDALAAASAAGANLPGYTRLMIVFPDSFGCQWAGYSSVGGCTTITSAGSLNATTSYLVSGYMGDRSLAVDLAAHEMGHSFGLQHSGTIEAGSNVLGPPATPGNTTDTGDYWSVMGERVSGVFPVSQRAEVLGWLQPGSNYQVVQSSGTFVLQPVETNPSGLQALKIQRGTGGDAWLWMEYRQPVGDYDSGLLPQVYSGALLHYQDTSSAPAHSLLPNFNPSDTTWNSPALAAGSTWADAFTNLSISVMSATPSALTVNVTYGSPKCIQADPVVTLSGAALSVFSGQSIPVTASVVNRDSAACPASTYLAGSLQPSSWPASYSSSSVTLSPGQQGTFVITFAVPAGTLPGTYPVSATATTGLFAGMGSATLMVSAAPSSSANLTVSGNIFAARQTASFTAAVTSLGKPAAGANVTFTIYRSDGTKLSQQAVTNAAGAAVLNYRVSPKDPPGAWRAQAQAFQSSSSIVSNFVVFTIK